MKRLIKPVLIVVVFVAGAFSGAGAQAHYTQLQVALADLQAARYHLSLAPIDPAGHRGTAISMLDATIQQVQLGMSGDR
jgi:hypothetical protein